MIKIRDHQTRQVLRVVEGDSLRGADLSGLDLRLVNLRGADLRETNLRWSNLSGMDLRETRLQGADLQEANLEHVNLSHGHLEGAILEHASFRYGDLSGASFNESSLFHTNFQRADVTGASFADILCFAGVNFADAKFPVGQFNIIPAGDVIGWKKGWEGEIVKLKIPAAARRSNSLGRKCRAEWAEVLATPGNRAVESCYETGFWYRVGETVNPNRWDDRWWEERSYGIHFYLTRDEAVHHVF